MSRPERWWRPSTNRRPAQRARASRYRRARYTADEVDKVIETSMDVGVIQGREWGERDLYRELAELLNDDPLDVIGEVAGRVIDEQVDDFLLLAQAELHNPDGLRRLADAVRDDTLDELAREMGVDDDLLDVADAVGATPIDPDAIDADDIGDAFEQWLRDQDDGAS